MRFLVTFFLLLVTAISCGGGSSSSSPPPSTSELKKTVLTESLVSPWGMVFLSDSRILVTQRLGTMVLLNADGSNPIVVSGTPSVDSNGQGGLLDVALDPEFNGTSNSWVYWTYSEPGTGGSGTAVARGRLVVTELQDIEVIFRQTPKLAGTGHYGSRLAFLPDNTLLVTLGERQHDDPSNPTTDYAQNVANDLGKTIRINRDGSIPSGNPTFVGAGALPELWSIGHRNPQGAAIRPGTSELWLTEHGPQGGDELNRIVPGGNYGWPLRSYGCPYGSPIGDTCRVGGGTHAPSFIEPVAYWVPTSIAPAGLMFYTGDKFPEWQGNAFLGALAGTALWRVELNGNTEATRERLLGDLGERIRDVRQGPDGWIYVLTDSGKLIRLER
jgi:aldose sugar dehydrogenase